MSRADEFDMRLLRLKLALQVRHDTDVGAALGLSIQALYERRTRGSFPTDKLYALAALRPELNLNVPYILSGSVAPAPDSLARSGFMLINLAVNLLAEVNRLGVDVATLHTPEERESAQRVLRQTLTHLQEDAP